MVHCDFTGTEINGEYLEIACIQRCILLCHTPYDQISKYFKCWDAFTRMLTNTTEITLNEETVDTKKLSTQCFLKSRWVKIKSITGPATVYQGEVYIFLKYFKIRCFLRVKTIYCIFLFIAKCHALPLVDDIYSRQ